MQPYHDLIFIREISVLFALGILVFLTRYLVRLRAVGVKGLQDDDAFTLIAMLSYIACMVATYLVYYKGSNLDFTAEQMFNMNMSERRSVELGSKMELVAWYTYVTLIWALKGCVMCFYVRLIVGLGMQRLTMTLAVASCVCYLAVMITITCSCYPFQKNWQVVPEPPKQCTISKQNLYVTAALNIFTDMLILCIPLPLLYNMTASFRRKAALSVLLLPGIFVIVAAIIRVTQSIGPNPSALNMNRWAARECLAGIVAVNLPIMKPIITKEFWRPGFRLNRSLSRRYTPSDYNDVERKFHEPDDSVYELEANIRISWEPPKLSTQRKAAHIRDASWDDTSSLDFIIRKPNRIRNGSSRSSNKSASFMARRKRKSSTNNSVVVKTTCETLRESRADTPPGFRTFGDSVSLKNPKFGNMVTIGGGKRPVSTG